MNRRTFLASTPAAFGLAAGIGLGGRGSAAKGESAHILRHAAGRLPGLLEGPIGVQLYTLRSLMRDDFDGVLEQVAAIGFREVEFAGYYDREPAALRRQLDALGLSAPAVHVPLQVVETDLESVVDAAHALGHRYIIVPYLDDRQRQGGADRYRELAETFNRVGEAAREAGVRFAYHNHDFEFERDGERVLFDVLLDETDPELVAIELDLFWIARAGFDPIDYFERYPGRFELFHVKDKTDDGRMVSVGDGAIDFAGIFDAAETAGVRHFFVEHDNPSDPLESIRTSYAYLTGGN